MPSIDEILNNLGVDEDGAEKVASSNSVSENEVEKQARQLGLIDENDENEKIASVQNEGESNMNLQDFYSMHFGGEEKTASAEYDYYEGYDEGNFEKEATALEQTGEYAGAVFNNVLSERLLTFSLTKQAMDGAPDSAATQAAQSGAGVIPSAAVKNPQLDVNRREDADKGMDTTPQHYDLMDAAVAKAKLKKALEEGKPGSMSHQVMSVDAREGSEDMPVGGSQKDA
jgi:hypothetical protein